MFCLVFLKLISVLVVRGVIWRGATAPRNTALRTPKIIYQRAVRSVFRHLAYSGTKLLLTISSSKSTYYSDRRASSHPSCCARGVWNVTWYIRSATRPTSFATCSYATLPNQRWCQTRHSAVHCSLMEWERRPPYLSCCSADSAYCKKCVRVRFFRLLRLVFL